MIPGSIIAVIAVVLFVLFLPFLVSLFATRTFAFIAFLASSASVTVLVAWAGAGAGAAGPAFTPPNPYEHIKYEIALWGFWLAAWVFAVAGIWRKRRNKNQLLGPIRSLYLTAFHDRLNEKERSYSDRRGRHNSN
jgi:glycerol-3-phosphate acyltransferase PlsY